MTITLLAEASVSSADRANVPADDLTASEMTLKLLADLSVDQADDMIVLEKDFVELEKGFNLLEKGFEGWKMDSMAPETQYQHE